ncbi:SCO4226 family nickel-binding protein [Nonomuraea sp. NPDC046570]|uniref:SCO4226 family nickel-binding protein n=1 Tax=Nonomuraea sp. NPDC046570 TaxID=3155255 RepID=UPI00340C7400
MTKFMDVHHGMVGITDQQFHQAHAADLAIQGDEGVTFEHAWADPEAGIVYCLSEAPDADAVQRVHQRAGHPADEIHRVPLSL